MGCLRDVYFDRHNLLYNLRHGNVEARHHGPLPLELDCPKTPPTSLPITLQGPRSYFKVTDTPIQSSTKFKLKFQFRQHRRNVSRLASGQFTAVMFDDDLDGLQLKRWFLLAKGRDLKFTIETWESNADPGTSSQKRQLVFTLSNDGTLNGTGSKLWNHIELVVNRNGFIWLSSNGVTVQGRYNARFDHFGGGTGGRDVHFGSLDPFSPFIGCLQNIELNEVGVDPMALMAASATSSSDMFGRSYTIVGNVTLDNCASLSPCSNMAQVCEHGGRCVPKMDGTYFCDCSHTGYVGRTCHFCKFPAEFKNFDLFIFDFSHSCLQEEL